MMTIILFVVVLANLGSLIVRERQIRRLRSELEGVRDQLQDTFPGMMFLAFLADDKSSPASPDLKGMAKTMVPDWVEGRVLDNDALSLKLVVGRKVVH